MSKYTTQVRFLVEQFSDSSLTIKEQIEVARKEIFDFDYPIWSEDYKQVLETKILKHYFMKEIGLETYGLWKFFLDEKMNLIMPYYNEVYSTTSKKYDWLNDVDVTENYDNEQKSTNIENNNQTTKTINDGNSNSKTNTQGTNKDNIKGTSKGTFSEYPQSDYTLANYATNANVGEFENTSNGQILSDTSVQNQNSNTIDTNNSNKKDNTTNSTNTYTKIIKGLNGGKSRTSLNLEYRQALINIDEQIINELKSLFMQIY